MSRRSLVRGSALALATSALLVVPMATPAFASSSATDPQPINGYRSVGYLMADAPVSRDFQVRDIIDSGAIDSLTHINYAFGNVTNDLVCDITNPTEENPAEPGNEGDAFNDYLRLVPAEDSVNGTADTEDQKLAGNFNQLLQLKEKYPKTKVIISLGGWTWSGNFFEAAATPESRTKLVKSCIDTYLRGNLPVVGTKGGEGAAAGLFDGIDIDWEWPATGGNTPDNVTPEDKENFLALMAEFRTQLDEYSAETNGEHYTLSAFAPVGGWNTTGGWRDASLFDSVDWLNVQGYDFHGGWVPDQTGHQGNLLPDGDNNWGLALGPELQAYIDAGARPDQLNAGLAAYGHGWYGVEAPGGAWQHAAGYVGTETYGDLRRDGVQPEDFSFDANVGAASLFREKAPESSVPEGTDPAKLENQWWSLDTPASVAAKSAYVAEHGYGGVMWWDLSGDFNNELVGAAGQAFRDAQVGPLTAPVVSGPKFDNLTVGQAVDLSLSATGAGPHAFAVTEGSLPKGLTFGPAKARAATSPTGDITGTPTEAGPFSFTVTATNGFGESEPVTFSGTVAAAEVVDPTPEPTVEPTTSPSAPDDGQAPDKNVSVSTTDESAEGDLAKTGSEVNGMLGIAGLLLALGGAVGALGIARARRRTE